MTPLESQVYFSRPRMSFWNWASDMESVNWWTGGTIAFYQEIAAVMGRLADGGGLPSLDAVMMLMAACRDGWEDRWLLTFAGQAHCEEEGILLCELLQTVRELPSNYRGELSTKELLAELVFAAVPPKVRPPAAGEIARMLEEGLSLDGDVVYADGKGDTRHAERFRAMVAELEPGLRRLTHRRLELRKRTGLDVLPEAEDAPQIPDVEKVRVLLRELAAEDDELAGIAMVAQNLMAAVHIPRAIAEPEELPLGGYSDIANRGTLDRLLLTELAQDDDTLAVRVSMNEALYLRREAPPKQPQRERVLLIDAGIRLWGVPRLIATSLALAFFATATRQQELRAFRAAGDNVALANLLEREGLIQHLEALPTAPDPIAALPAFAEIASVDGGADVIVITHKDTFAQPAVQAALKSMGREQIFVATVDRGGNYALYALTRRGTKRLQVATCDPALLAQRRGGSAKGLPLIRDDIEEAFPLALRLKEFPLRMPHGFNTSRNAFHPKVGLVSYSRHGSVLVFDKAGSGARCIYSISEEGRVVWLGIRSDGSEVLLVQQGDLAVLTRIPLAADTAPARAVLQVPGAVTSVREVRGMLAVAHTRISLVDFEGAQICEAEINAPFASSNGPYLKAPTAWYRLTTDGKRLVHERVELPDGKGEIVACFDRRGHEGTHVILRSGIVYRLAPDPMLVAKSDIDCSSVLAISRDGERLMIRSESSNRTGILDLSKGKVIDVGTRRQNPDFAVEPRVQELIRQRPPTMRKRFIGIGFVDGGKLGLRTRNHEYLALARSSRQQSLVLETLGTVDSLFPSVIGFSRMDSPFAEVHEMSIARFPDGSNAYLDGRGFLHLESRDPGLPEMTLALKDGSVAVWFSDGSRNGDPYFTGGERDTVDASAVIDHVASFAKLVGQVES